MNRIGMYINERVIKYIDVLFSELEIKKLLDQCYRCPKKVSNMINNGHTNFLHKNIKINKEFKYAIMFVSDEEYFHCFPYFLNYLFLFKNGMWYLKQASWSSEKRLSKYLRGRK